MPAFNSVHLIGNVTRDIELKYTQSGTAVAEFGLAINEKRKQRDEWVEEVTFVDITVWGRTAEVAQQYLKKGSPCMVSGRLKLDQWESQGQKRSKLKVVCDKLVLLGSRKSHQENKPDSQQGDKPDSHSQPARQDDYHPGPDPGEEDIPF